MPPPDLEPVPQVSRSPDELLYDAEASLRLVDQALRELRPQPEPPGAGGVTLEPEVPPHDPADEPPRGHGC